MKKSLKVFMLLLAIFSTALLAACTKEADTTLADAKTALALTFQSGDSATSVTKDLALPTTVGEVTIAWTSSAPSVIANDGKVTRPSADTPVTLTAKLSYKGNDEQKVFSVTVKAAEPTGPTEAEKAAAISALRAIYEDTLEDIEYEVVADLALVATVSGYSVTWASANTGLIANDGKVTRPAFTKEGGETVKLTATITVEGEAVTVEFYAFVKCLDKTLEETLAEAVNLGAAFVSDVATVGVTSDQTLNKTVTFETIVYDIVWTSSHPEIISTTGKVTRPALGLDDAIVTLTATITKDGVSASKDVVFKVLSFKPSRAFDDISSMYVGAEKAKDAEYVKVLGAKVFGKINDGIFLHDGVNIIYIFDRNRDIYNNLEIGKVYDIEGEFDIYFGSPQLKGFSSNALTAKESTEVIPDLVPDVVDFADYINGLAVPVNQNELSFILEYVTIKAKVIVDAQEGSNSNYKYWLVPEDYTDPTIIKKISSEKATEYFIPEVANIYYQSNEEVFASLHGKVVTIDFLVYGYRTDRFVWYGNFFGTEADIEIHFEKDSDAIAAAKANIETSIPTVVPSATTLNLKTSLFGTTIAWTSSNEAVINPTTGVVTPVAGTATSVTLTGTITKGTETAVVVTIVVKVGEVDLSTVEQVVAAAVSDKLYRIQGTLVGHDFFRNFYVHQDGHAITISTGDAAEQAILKGLVGKQVEIIGTRGDYKGAIQMDPVEIKDLGVSTVVPAKVNIDAAAALDAAAMTPYQGKLVELTNLLVKSRDDKNNFVLERADGKTIAMSWFSSAILSPEQTAVLADIKVNDRITYVDFMVYNNGVPRFTFTNFSQVTKVAVTDQDKVNAVAAALPKTISLSAAGAIELSATGADNTTIAYALKNADDANKSLIDLTAKTVTMPTSGQVTIVIVATVTLNDKTATAEISVVLGQEVVVIENAVQPGVYTFGTVAKTGYAAGQLVWNEAAPIGEVSWNKARVQINTSTFKPHDTAGAILILSINSTEQTAWIEFGVGSNVGQIKFGISVWNNTLLQTVKDTPNGLFILQVKNGTEWTNVATTNGESNLLPLLTLEQYIDVTFNVATPGIYRLVYTGQSTASNNTTTAVTLNQIEFIAK